MEALDLTIYQGKTFRRVIRWEKEPFLYAAITAIAKQAPVRITAPSHGLPDGWRAAVVSVSGMRQINAANSPPLDTDFHRVTVIDENIVEINTINAAQFSTYTSGGYLQFYTPASLAGSEGRMTIRDRIGGTALLSTEDASISMVLDDAAKTITITIDATDTAAIDWSNAVHDIEVEDGSGFVTGLYAGSVNVEREATT